MKICIFSDSHGYAGKMISAIGIENPDMCFFLGDGERDLAAVREQFPGLPFYAVKGNCDLRSKLSVALTCAVGGVSIFATHGHMYNVKYEPGLETLTYYAREAGASVALFGHTHRQHLSENDGVLLINPGPAGRSSYGCYAVLIIENGRYRADLRAV